MWYRSSLGVPAAGTMGIILCSFGVRFEAHVPYRLPNNFLAHILQPPAPNQHPVLSFWSSWQMVLMDPCSWVWNLGDSVCIFLLILAVFVQRRQPNTALEPTPTAP